MLFWALANRRTLRGLIKGTVLAQRVREFWIIYGKMVWEGWTLGDEKRMPFDKLRTAKCRERG